MDSVKEAAKLLAHATSRESALPLLSRLGFSDPPLPLSDSARNDLGLQSAISTVDIARGPGALRALLLGVSTSVTTRELIQQTSAALSSRVPHLLWIVVVVNRPAGEVSIACWRASVKKPRVVALIADVHRILESDADTLCALCSASSSSDILTHVRWIELLGREAITRRFFRCLRDVVDVLASELPKAIASRDRKELSVLMVSRLLFLSFLETKGWLAGDFDFLANQFGKCMVLGGEYHRRVLLPLFFGTLNTRSSKRAERARAFGRIPFLNGGLFTRTHLERAHSRTTYSDEALGSVFTDLLTSFRFSAREDSEHWSETAVDPEILGKAFEALMASAERKSSGAFYTPQRLVEHVAESAIVASLSPMVDREILRALLVSGQLPQQSVRDELLARLRRITILDPACGSGAFLVHILDKVTELRLRLGEIGSVAAIRRDVLSSSIFGVDVNPMAVWLCQLRLWLAIVIDSTEPDPMRVVPLPNLDRQIRIGDSLSAGSFTQEETRPRGTALGKLRARYVRSVGTRKKFLARQLDREERREALRVLAASRSRLRYQRRDLVISARSLDLFGSKIANAQSLANIRALRKQDRAAAARERAIRSGAGLPFTFNIHFADIATKGGFDVIVGNPPWVRIHNIGPGSRAALNREFLSFSGGGWRAGADLAGSGRAFANQVDLASLFLERSLFLLREGGALALLVPAKLWRSLSGGGIRDVLKRNLELAALEDMTESRTGFDAAVYPSLIVGRRQAQPSDDNRFSAAVHRGESVLQWEMGRDDLPLDRTRGSPWLIAPREVRNAFRKLSDAGVPLAESRIGRPVLGVKTGCNSAFIVEDDETVTTFPREFLRPVVRGETAAAWRFAENRERILWTHAENGRPVSRLPADIAMRLQPFRTTLERRSDARSASRWWSLFRTEGAASKYWRVVWADFGKAPRALVLPFGSQVVPLNTCYVACCKSREDALTLAALLNGPLLSAWLNAIAEPARGGYRRYLGWTVSLMPVPHDWAHAKDVLGPVAERALNGVLPTQYDLLCAALDAFRIRRSDVEALISWTIRS